eukprot:scaffold22577_cov122-Cylindrotheca_fusiformis.AAC.28
MFAHSFLLNRRHQDIKAKVRHSIYLHYSTVHLSLVTPKKKGWSRLSMFECSKVAASASLLANKTRSDPRISFASLAVTGRSVCYCVAGRTVPTL